MNMMDSKAGTLLADTSLISPEFIRRLHEQRVLHKREVAFYMAEAEKHGAADEALASMIQAAEKVVAILFPVGVKTADAPDEAPTEDMSSSPSWTEATMAVVPKTAEPLTYTEPPTAHGLEDLMSDDHAGKSGNAWRARLLGSRP
jgi:hypothetical protein